MVVTWRRVQSRGGYSTAAHHDIATTEGYFHLVLDQNMTGLVELSVSFHDDHCMKQSSVQFEGKITCVDTFHLLIEIMIIILIIDDKSNEFLLSSSEQCRSAHGYDL